jgi:hypothetical protein
MLKVLSIILCLLIPLSTFAEPRVSSMKEGDKAPYAGYLFDYEAFATMEAGRNIEKQRCELEKKYLNDKCISDCSYKISSCNLEKELLKKNLDAALNVNLPDNRFPVIISAGVGLVAGVVLTILTVRFIK